MDQDQITIPYFSGQGHTARLAAHIADGAGGARLVDVSRISAEDWTALDASRAIIFGSPTYMGSTAAAFDQFLEDAGDRWMDHRWTDKIAAGFTVATNASGDKLAALMRMAVYAGQMGMIWVGQAEIGSAVDASSPGINRDGSWLGLMARSSRDKSALIDPEDAQTARLFGARIKTAAKRWG